VLKSFGREAQLKRKWNRLWSQIGDRILSLPNREQDILLEDFLTAIQSRILVMERINDEKRNS
jgi:glycosylphosphatidylinositol transamidase (GPIT) subunit GPI8